MDPINFKKKKKKIPNITLDDVIEPVQVLVKTVVVLMVGSEPARSCASTILGKSHLLSFLVSTEQNIQNYVMDSKSIETGHDHEDPCPN